MTTDNSTRRQFLQTTTTTTAVAGASALLSIPKVHAAEDGTIQIALIGCGGRGTGAATNALKVDNGPIKLVAMADVFPDKLSASHHALTREFGDSGKMDVPEDRRFIGFDAYSKAMDCLKPGDIVAMATPVAFRVPMFRYAISKGLNVFMEKPITMDGPTSGRMFELGRESVAKNLKVGVGLMCRHCDARKELYQRIKNGEIGEILSLRAYRMAGPTGSAAVLKRDPNKYSELMYQIHNFHGFLWASGGAFSDFLIHNIDECCWMKDAWPIEAKGSGGRHYRGDYVDQNFDSYSVEYTFADGTKLYLYGRTMPGCHQEFASYAHGTKAVATISTAAHTPAKCKIYKAQRFSPSEIAWQVGPGEPNPYQLEWDHLIDAVRNDRPFNEVERGTQASLVTSMGRMAAHTGRKISYDEMLECEHEFAPNVESLTLDGPAPLQADAEGRYPVPQPGLVTEREF